VESRRPDRDARRTVRQPGRSVYEGRPRPEVELWVARWDPVGGRWEERRPVWEPWRTDVMPGLSR
jgi:hypothetical protein